MRNVLQLLQSSITRRINVRYFLQFIFGVYFFQSEARRALMLLWWRSLRSIQDTSGPRHRINTDLNVLSTTPCSELQVTWFRVPILIIIMRISGTNALCIIGTSGAALIFFGINEKKTGFWKIFFRTWLKWKVHNSLTDDVYAFFARNIIYARFHLRFSCWP